METKQTDAEFMRQFVTSHSSYMGYGEEQRLKRIADRLERFEESLLVQRLARDQLSALHTLVAGQLAALEEPTNG